MVVPAMTAGHTISIMSRVPNVTNTLRTFIGSILHLSTYAKLFQSAEFLLATHIYHNHRQNTILRFSHLCIKYGDVHEHGCAAYGLVLRYHLLQHEAIPPKTHHPTFLQASPPSLHRSNHRAASLASIDASPS